MNDRIQRAAMLGTKASLVFVRMVAVPRVVALVWIAIAHPSGLADSAGVVIGAIIPTFVLYLGLIFGLAAAFPPPPDRLEFPGAGRFVWPVVTLLVLATAYLVW